MSNTLSLPQAGWYYQNKQTKELVLVQIVSVNENDCDLIACPLLTTNKPIKNFLDFQECERLSIEQFNNKYRLYNP